jgi:hypothetical protein
MTSLIHVLHRKHGRPKWLSDPFRDNSPAGLRSLLATADADLECSDFKNLLGPHLPAGTYAEVVYFLPLAFDYVRAHSDVALDLCTSLAWFCSEYADNLAADGALDAAQGELRGLLLDWTSRFEIEHFDARMCASKGWGLQYFDYVRMSETVCEMLSDLVRFQRLAEVAERNVAEFVDFGADAIKAAWLLELIRCRTDVYRPPELAALDEASNDSRLLQSAFLLAQSDPLLQQTSRTYWGDLQSALGIVDCSRR